MDIQSLKATEEVGARSATHPRVTLKDIENSIGSIHFSTADRLLPDTVPEGINIEPLKILTICVIVMNNGFVVLGKSAPASVENYTREKGEELAYEDAVRSIWPLMGFALRDRLHRDSADFETFERVTSGDGAAGQTGADLVGEDGPAPIDEDATLEYMRDDALYQLARDHGVPIQGATRAGDIAALKAKRDRLVGGATGTGTLVKDASPVLPSTIPDDEELEGLLDQPVKDLALAHGLDYADRRDAIDKLKIKRAAISGQPNAI